MATESPSARSRWAIARPIPRLPPVTSTDLPTTPSRPLPRRSGARRHATGFGRAASRAGRFYASMDLRPRRFQVTHAIDAEFSALPLRGLADAALSRAQELGASYAAFRLERIRGQAIRVRDAAVEGVNNSEDIGFSVRVVLDGTWGFASDVTRTPEAAVAAVERAVELARVSRPLNTDPVELAPEPSHGDVTWVSSYRIDPFAVSDADKVARLQDWSNQLLAADVVSHVDAELMTVRENTFYADLTGTVTTQQRVRLQPQLTVVAVDQSTGGFETMRTTAPPVGRGWEYLDGEGWDWAASWAQLPDWLAERVAAPSVEPGRYDLVIDPDQLVADDPRVGGARHRARPRPRLRGQLRRHVLRHPGPAEHAPVRLGADARHRRPNRRARPVDGRLGPGGRRGPAVRHRARRRAGRVPAGSADRRRLRLRALQRLRLRRLRGTRADPTHGQHLARSRWSTDRAPTT